ARSPHSPAAPGSRASAPARPRPDAQRFRARVEKALADAQAQKALWGILVADRDSGEVLYDLNAGRFFTPGSNQKLLTTTFALASLGSDYRYHTTLESAGALAANDKLPGDLVLVGRGDPDLSNRVFPYAEKAERSGPLEKVLAELADAVVAKGLREVDGDIVADDSYFPYDPYPAGWSAGDLFFSFGAPVSAIAFNENTVTVTIQPGALVGDPAVVSVVPAAAAATLTVDFTTSASSEPPDFGVGRAPGEKFLLLRGAIPFGHEPMRFDLAMPDPADTAARTLKQLLEQRGVLVAGTVRVRHAPPPADCIPAEAQIILKKCLPLPAPNANVLAEHISLPLIESVRLTNKLSQNLHAELFLRTVAREKSGYGANDPGLWLEQAFLAQAGVPDGDAILSDGSGLSHDDLITPRGMVALLRYAAQQPWGPDFVGTLPIAGVDGTLESRMKGTPAAGLIQAKTGTLEEVHALSGYATTLGGERLVFAIFGNNNPQKGHDATATIDAIAVAMVETLGPSRSAKRKK
ncbi:MAG: D-alanyl-D-alanine carboxypeptidase/D-alanyl-D-alanine-endopeptidase, partial [Candidatus Acidiferrales bacterium]